MANFVVSGTPHVRSKESIQSIMRDVIIALVPATAAGIYYFGLRALILIVAAIISAVFFEWLYEKITKKPVTIQRKNGLCLRIPTRQSLTPTHGRGCRNYGKTNAARRGQERQICFPALCAVPIAAKSCITAQARTLKRGKTISFVPLQGSKEKKFAQHILSARSYWNRTCLLT